MDKKLTFTGGEPNINWDDILRDPVANRAALFGLMATYAIGTNENFVISGCVATLDPGVDVDVTAGYIYLTGEILEVEAQTVLDSGTVDLYKYVKTTTFESGGDKTFNDSIARQTWQKNRGIVTATSVVSPTTDLDVVSGSRLEDKIAELVNGERVKIKVIEIDDWNMDTQTTPPTPIAHGLTYANIIGVTSVLIRNDADSAKYDFTYPSASVAVPQGAIEVNTTNVILTRITSGFFDSVNFDSTSYNRGWVIIQYLP